MDIAKITEELEAKIPRDAVSMRDSGKGGKLSYLETWYVIDRMNKVFGNLNWSCETVDMRQSGTTQNRNGDPLPVYVAKVRITVLLENGYTIMREGTGWGCDKSTQNPHEMAVKEAESDAFKRAAMKFGTSMGLALYDKSQENVDDGRETAKKQPAARKGNPSGAEQTVAPSVSRPDTKFCDVPETREAVNKLISETARAAVSFKKITKEDLSKLLSDKYTVNTKEQLTDEQAKELLSHLRTLVG